MIISKNQFDFFRQHMQRVRVSSSHSAGKGHSNDTYHLSNTDWLHVTRNLDKLTIEYCNPHKSELPLWVKIALEIQEN